MVVVAILHRISIKNKVNKFAPESDLAGGIDDNGNALCKILQELQYNDVTRRQKVNLTRSLVWGYKPK